METLSLELPLKDPIGEGTSGVVYPLKTDDAFGRYVVKRMKKTQDQEVFAEEVRLLKLVSAEACDATLWDALTGATTWRTTALAPLGFTERHTWSAQLCAAVCHCHSLGVLHRDINPWNALLIQESGTWNLRLGDFGLAVPCSGDLQGIEAPGVAPLDASALTSLYSAPELGKRYGYPADVFSLGMTLLALWTERGEDDWHVKIGAVASEQGQWAFQRFGHVVVVVGDKVACGRALEFVTVAGGSLARRWLADRAKIRAPIADALKVRQPQAMSVPKDMANFDDADMAILHNLGIETDAVIHNARPGTLYDEALRYEKGSAILSTGALAAYSGAKTGRSPMDKRVVEEPSTIDDVWWGTVNMGLSEKSFSINRERAIDYLNTRPRLYVLDGFAGWDPEYRYKIRVITSRAYHALFMHNMLIRPTAEELANFGEPDYTIYNAGAFPANRATDGMTSGTSVSLNFATKEVVILGSQYAGEMKKGVFTIMNYLLPKQGILSMHASANEGEDGDVTVFFGLSGTGKTTLSADENRKLIGDDEHAWTDKGVFNIEGGCYAKAIGLTREKEPEIWDAIRFGALLENVVFDQRTGEVDYNDSSITENTRVSYPLEYIPNVKIPAVGGHPKNIIMLTCDAFGVLPPVSKLTPSQAMYHFISGYTAKVAGTEMGISEPTATFSACFGAPFMVWHPAKYAELLAEKMAKHNVNAWLINTGWTGGAFGSGHRMSLKDTRAIIDAIHSGDLAKAEYENFPRFNLQVPKTCPNVDAKILMPNKTWSDQAEFEKMSAKLSGLFKENFTKFQEGCSEDIRAAAPQ
ncbi:unnamed protein product [Durusdinium trenchii]|uniref:phosphoenolpyruvate carboxykinase (ATP) n=1 Tax=Durusdinium trenchii TaxID=1381693 RepID=A0ABP0PZW4_9DINO